MQKRSSWQIQKAVFMALFFREMKTRFGRYRLSYFWALIEPLSQILLLSVLFSLIRDDGGFYDIPFPVFFATGILAFFAFQKIVLMLRVCIQANKGLFSYKQVKPIDTVVVRAVIEFLIIVSTIIVLMWLGAWFFQYSTFPHDPLKAVGVLLMLFLLGLSIGLSAAIIGSLYEEWAQFIPQLMRPLYFISGIFFPLAAIPENLQPYLLWNPVLHGLEQFRAAWIEGYPAGETSLFYLLFWLMPLLAFGVYFFRKNQIRAIMS